LKTDEIPEDVIVVYIDEGEVQNNHHMPKLPLKDIKILIA